ncbi:MAG: hypothetical protein IKR68_02780 [Lachnospiraceae bacterium]|nr:hypothetical protein [Lachnospiraceae bacterium]
MKKRILALVISGIMAASMMTACGGTEKAEPAPAETKTEEKTEEKAEENTEEKAEEKTEEKAEESTGSITFEDLQDNYKILVDCYNQVEDLYMNEQIAQSDETESLLTEAKGIIDEMGEATEDDFAGEQDMVDMNDAMATMIDALGKIVDGMETTDAGESSDASGDVTFVDGFYATDANGNDFMIAFYEGAAGDVAYVNDGTDEVFAEYTVENASLDDGTEYLLVTVGQTQLGYYEDGSDIYMVDADGQVYGAARLTEEEADALAQAASSN